MKPEDRVKHIAKMQRFFAEDAIGARECFRVMQRKTVINSFREGRGPVPMLLRGALLERMVMAFARMLDPPKTDKDSLNHAFELLRDPSTRAAVAASGDERRLVAAMETWARLSHRRKLLSRIKGLRDYWIAHTITSKWGSDKTELRDLLAVERAMRSVIEDLSAGCGLTTVSIDAVAKVKRDQAVDFWRRVVHGSAALQLDRKSEI